ncbi:LOW QUALITY PROTEIN: hypothetical protein Smp_177710 [Schistosoma mansoni]|uniref:hypothetical protein n=1 Tax=Schistosoma mansoni TaxID=6183 RepID=UPI00022C834A|nr:LOW QUALITY PROTEIN: hypothetical protein Smp_177710 [Schistosoma mansoni]|eukprot:XP_018647236.1 LOW QUALITY PROTEIN: hypothetical protein Smp_177710 [Schistosoma mansoni]
MSLVTICKQLKNSDALCNNGNESRGNFKTPNETKLQSNVPKDFREIILNSPKLSKVFNKLTGTDQEVEITDANNCTSEDLSPEMHTQSNPLITMAEDKQNSSLAILIYDSEIH